MNPAADRSRELAVLRHRLHAEPQHVAGLLLGAQLCSDLGAPVTIRVTEVEAYAGVSADPGSHAHRGPSRRNRSMFGPVGHAYVYFTYGMHWCLNVVVHRPDRAGAVLIRAGEVVTGRPTAQARRPTARAARDLARGPARLATCLGVTGDVDGIDLLDPQSPIRLWADATAGDSTAARIDGRIKSGPRTGVAGSGALTPWRFWLAGEASVSPYRPAARRPSG